MADIWLTPEEITKREERLEILKTTRRLEIAEQLKIARAFGDLSENAEYDAAKNEQAKNEYDIQQLENELKNAKVIDENAIDVTTVGVVTVSWRAGESGDPGASRIPTMIRTGTMIRAVAHSRGLMRSSPG